MTEIIYLAISAAVGFALAWFIMRHQSLLKISALSSEKDMAESRSAHLIQQNVKLELQCSEQTEKIITLNADVSGGKRDIVNLRQKLEDQKVEQEDMHARMKTEFQVLADDLLEDKSRRFTEQNKSNMDAILNPLSEKIKAFEKKVEETYDKELRDKISLREEVKKLYDLNVRISTEANNLTKALRGDTRKQGNWGEWILLKILEQSGLKKGVEYETQFITTSQNGTVIKPDVVIFLPDNKHLIIDSKVSLTAYDRYVNCEEEGDIDKCLKEHLISVRNHIKLLGEKSYSSAQGLRSPDLVLLFMPLESSFSLAVQHDNELFNFAWDRQIVIVSPTTLLATLTTVASLWKIENQNKNALEIARLSGIMYDKLVGFMEDMIKVGNSLRNMDDQYKSAMNKLHEGSGNVIRTAEKVKELGAKNSKSLPSGIILRAGE
ncbi:MAG: DNA recombination protein RmuC [Chitinophagales bacterium]|nr:DNA recombination protein RmuC [Chitinophagales bacterium]